MRKTKVFLKCLAVCIAMLMSIGLIVPNSVLACPPPPQQVKYTVSFVDTNGNTIAAKVEKTGAKDSWVYGSNEAISIAGYEYSYSNPFKIKLSSDISKNKLTLVYEKLYDYSINYYIKGTTTKISPTVNKEAKKGTFINTGDQVKSIFGYSYNDRTPDHFLKVSSDEAKNVINIYYCPVSVNYKVKHVVEATGEVLDEGTYSGKHNVDVTINANSYTGYTATNAPLTATPVKGGQNVFTVYYVANQVGYTVKHVVQATGEVLDEEMLSGSHNTPLTINANSYTGYTANNAPLNVTLLEGENNVFTVYYEANEVNYKVKHVVEATGEVLDEVDYVGLHGVSDIISANSYTGYTATNAPLTVTPMEGEENVFTIYYEANDVEYTVKYVEKDNPSNELLPMDTFTGKHGQQVDVDAKDVAGYTPTLQTQSITPMEGEGVVNELVFEYTADEQVLTVKYLNKEDDTPVADEKVITGVTGQVITESPIDIEGYSPVDESEETITLDEGDNTIIFYYEELEVKVLSEVITPQVKSSQEANPQTGEHPYEMAWLMWILSAALAVAILFIQSKRQVHKK